MLDKLIELADKEYDGKFTIHKLGTLYGVCLGIPVGRPSEFSKHLAMGETLEEAIGFAVENKIDAISIKQALELELQIDKNEYYMYSSI